jgi:putative SOS response-associated peptidase YedK
MCGKFTQMASWAEVHTFSTPLDGGDVVESDHHRGTNDREETFTPMRDARVTRLTEAGKRELVSMRWGWPGSGAIYIGVSTRLKSACFITLPAPRSRQRTYFYL